MDRPRREQRTHQRHVETKRAHLQSIAQSTIEAINKGYYQIHDPSTNLANRYLLSKSVIYTQRHTQFFPSDSPLLANWRAPVPPPHAGVGAPHVVPVTIAILQMSTLQGAREISQNAPGKKIGVLNFASATKPGGGFINGASAQEESIARSSTLYVSLTTPNARRFYDLHDANSKGGYYTHAMIYSPNVQLFRDDHGEWLPPVGVDVLTSPAVNAGLVRKLKRRRKDEVEGRIQEVMGERMGRILALFEKQGARNLVLGSFGTGVFQNDVIDMAQIWAELLHAPGARFATSFDTIYFTIPDPKTRTGFESGFLPKSWVRGVL